MFVSGQLNCVQVQGGEESPLQHKPPTQSTKPVASASGRFILCSLIFADAAHLVCPMQVSMAVFKYMKTELMHHQTTISLKPVKN